MDDKEKKLIFEKTNGKCHICGGDIGTEHGSIFLHEIYHDNKESSECVFLPAHEECINLRGNYTPQEWKKIFGLGISLRKLLSNNGNEGIQKIKEKFLDWQKNNNKNIVQTSAKHEKKNDKREKFSQEKREEIKRKTNGFCHFCGGSITQYYEIDHLLPHVHYRNGELNNLLPIHGNCNRLKWSYYSEDIKLLIYLGIFAWEESNKSKVALDINDIYLNYLKRKANRNKSEKLNKMLQDTYVNIKKNKIKDISIPDNKAKAQKYFQILINGLNNQHIHYESSIYNNSIIHHLDLENGPAINLIKPIIPNFISKLNNIPNINISCKEKEAGKWYWLILEPNFQDPKSLAELMKSFIELTKDEIIQYINKN